MKQRFMLKRDDDCHWYLIKVEDEADFEAWVESSWLDSELYQGRSFDDDRIDSPYNLTFTDPTEN